MTKNLLKVTGFLIATAALIYKIIMAVRYFDNITSWWNNNWIILYFLLYMTSLATMISSLLKSKKGLIISLIVIVGSVVLLIADAFIWFGLAVSFDTGSMAGKGIMPLVNVFNLMAGIFNLLGTEQIKKGRTN